MASCPFCAASITADLEEHGGSCPSCLNHIPGVEAPTDPGEARREEALRRDAEAAGVRLEPSRTHWYVVGAVVLVGTLVVAGTSSSRIKPSGPVPVGDFYMLPNEEVVQITAELDAAALSTAPAAGGASAVEPRGAGSAAPEHLRPLAGGARAPSSPAEGTVAASTGPSLTLGGAATDLARRGAVLTDEAEIRAMVSRAIGAYAPQLRTCYEQRLREDGSLRGSWVLNFVVGPDGSLQEPTADPQGPGDPLFEACMEKAMSTWRFQPVAQPLGFAKRYAFGPVE